MIKLFIYANSYVTHTFLFNLDYILNVNVCEIFLLKENHKCDDIFILNKSIKITYLQRLNECVKLSDIILIISDETISPKKYEQLVTIAKLYNKQIVNMYNPWIRKDINEAFNDINENIFSKVPTILNIGLGKVPQLYCIEILLNKILTSYNVSFKQYFSFSTKKLLDQIASNNLILNPAIGKQMISTADNVSVIIYSITIDTERKSILKYLNEIKSIHSDFTVIQVDKSCPNLDEIRNIFKYGGLSPIDIIIKSKYNFIQIYNAYVRCNDSINNQLEDSVDLCDPNLENIIADRMFAKLTYPSNIIKIQPYIYE